MAKAKTILKKAPEPKAPVAVKDEFEDFDSTAAKEAAEDGEEDADPYHADDEEEEAKDTGYVDPDLEAEEAAEALLEDEDGEDPIQKPAPAKKAAAPTKKSKKEQEPKYDKTKMYKIDLKKEEAKDPEKEAVLEEGANSQAGYLNQYGILFPVGFKFKGGLVSWRGSIVLNRCPKCGHHNMSTEAVKGECSNERGKNNEPCKYSLIESIEKIRTIE